MPTSCIAFNCTSRHNKESGITFHSFPFRDKLLLSTWTQAVRRDHWQPDKSSRLCSLHFEEKWFTSTNDRRRLLNQALPTIFDFPEHLKKPTPKPRASRKRCRSPEVSVEVSPCAELHENDHEQCSSTAHTLHDHVYSVPSPRKLQKKFQDTVDKCASLAADKKKNLQAVRRHKKKIRTLEDVVAGLKSRLSNTQGAMIIENCFSDTLKELLQNQSTEHASQYSKNVQQFALTLHFYSAKAYDYLREIVKLPHPSTLRRWATAIGGKPGFTEESFLKIAEEVKAIQATPDGNGNPGRLFCCLLIDDMSIKKQVDFDGKEVVGYCDLGHGYIADDEVPIATYALVFMVTAINRNWKLPIGYCLIDGLDGSVRANIAKMYLQKLHEVGAECIALTCDGTSCNLLMFSELGVQFNPTATTGRQNWFIHPADPEMKVYAILDPAHMIKLLRNLIGEKSVIIDSSKPEGNQMIEWRFFKNLNSLQEDEGLHAGNKLRRGHIMYHKQKMKVALAAQTLSMSVSSALRFCEQSNICGFDGASTTAEFASKIDDVFDLLNSCHVFGKYSKSPIRKSNKEEILKRIDDGIKYLEGLKEPGPEGKSIVQGRRKTGVLGFIIDLMSVRNLAEELVWEQSSPLVCLLAKKLSQDHLEMFFGCIRKRTGDNNNPTALQFRWAYRKCLLAKVSPPSNGNCEVDRTELLDTGDSTGSISIPQTTKSAVLFETDHSYIHEYEQLTLFSHNIVEYIAGFVARYFMKNSKCPDCNKLLLGDNDKKRGLLKVKDCGGLFVPSVDLVKLCQYGERVLRSYSLKQLRGSNWLLKLQCEVMGMIYTTNIFKNDHLFLAVSLGGEQHYSVLIKTCLQMFFKLMLNHKCKEMSQLERGEILRQQLTKLILFKGQ